MIDLDKKVQVILAKGNQLDTISLQHNLKELSYRKSDQIPTICPYPQLCFYETSPSEGPVTRISHFNHEYHCNNGFFSEPLSRKFNGCITNRFCLDCGTPKAQPPVDFIQDLSEGIESKLLKKLTGEIEIQILVDSTGTPCLLSANNKTEIKSSKLGLQQAVNNTEAWIPATENGKSIKSSVSIVLSFLNGTMVAKRRVFDSKNAINISSVIFGRRLMQD